MVRSANVLIVGENTPWHFDRIVMCAGLESSALLEPLGLKIPVAAVYGYSIGAPLREALNAPRSALMDERYKVAISRLGNRVQVAGSAEIDGSLGKHRASTIQTLTGCCATGFRVRQKPPTTPPILALVCRSGKEHVR